MSKTNQLNGDEQDVAAYEKDLAAYLQERIKPGLSRSAIPLLARSIAKDITRRKPPEALDAEDSEADEEADSEADQELEVQADEQPNSQADEETDSQGDREQSDFEANMYELQADLGEAWVLHFSVQGGDGWLTAETQDGAQHVEAPDAQRLASIIDTIDECGGRRP
jgi:hypothetical protein